MRLARDVLRAQPPDLRPGRVGKLQAAVAAEDRDALEEIVERLALHLDEGVVRAFEREPVGDVFVEEGEAAERVRRDDHPQGPIVGQMEQLLLRLKERREHLLLLPLEGAEIGVFGQPPALAQPLEHLVERGLGAEKVLFEAPERGEGGVVELEPRVGPVDRDRGRDRLEHLGMGGDGAGASAWRPSRSVRSRAKPSRFPHGSGSSVISTKRRAPATTT